LSARESVSKLPEEKKPEKQLSINKDEISEVKEPEIEKGADIDPPETKKSSTKIKHEAVGMMLCGVCNHKVKASEPIRCPLCGAPSGRMKRI
jgi:rubrerythrin